MTHPQLYFYPRSPCGERPNGRACAVCPRLFLSTLSLRRATDSLTDDVSTGGFLSTLSLRRATYLVRGQRPSWGISIHALLAESDACSKLLVMHKLISIHALLAESDQDEKQENQSKHCISIHALLAESDQLAARDDSIMFVFLSTLSLRRATLEILLLCLAIHNFYPRSPCGERRKYHRADKVRAYISIHALLAESDIPYQYLSSDFWNFYPRSPCGERRWLRCWQLAARDISIHALLAESDLKSPIKTHRQKHFYPRSPCGERRWLRCWQLAARDISIHALLAESDCFFCVKLLLL